MNATSNQIEIAVDINGQSRTDHVPVRMHAADYLRHKCGLTGTHVGCEQGICGMCTVEVDGAVVKSCLMLAVQLDGKSVRTVESLAGPEGLTDQLNMALKYKEKMVGGHGLEPWTR